ncbi:MAG: YigZ family protein [Rhodospirillales bacterium]|jgi:uncharacterized YigZ family protein|nr:YigZ family protein [Rhodospirillales bacterium]
MSTLYTVVKVFTAETEARNSRFIAELLPYELLESRLPELREKHRKASHFATAYRYFNEQRQLIEHGKDDGEVSGTAGAPALRILQGHDLVECAIIIVRYFGGIKLGTGGLIRAYSDAAGTVAQKSKPVLFTHKLEIKLDCSFNHVSELERLCSQFKADVLNRDYTEVGLSLIIGGSEERILELQSEWQSFSERHKI